MQRDQETCLSRFGGEEELSARAVVLLVTLAAPECRKRVSGQTRYVDAVETGDAEHTVILRWLSRRIGLRGHSHPWPNSRPREHTTGCGS